MLGVAALYVAHRIRNDDGDVEHRSAFQTVTMSGSRASPRCRSTLTTAWVPARFPELSNTITRSSGCSKTVILQNDAKLSTPAFVREVRREHDAIVQDDAYTVSHARIIRDIESRCRRA